MHEDQEKKKFFGEEYAVREIPGSSSPYLHHGS